MHNTQIIIVKFVPANVCRRRSFFESFKGLSLLLHELSHYCNTWNLYINVEKSNIVAFEDKGKKLIGNDILEIVEQIIYLGFIFQYNTKFKKAEKQLSDQGRKAMIGLSVNIRCMLLNHKTL